MNSKQLLNLSACDEILVLGFGNPLMGDDGASVLALKMLEDALEELDLPANVRVEYAGTPGWGLPNWMEGYTSVMLVDTVDMKQEPGSWRCFRLLGTSHFEEEIIIWQPDERFSLHQPDLASGLVLAQSLGLLPDNLWLFGIQPASIVQNTSLDPQVFAGLPGLVKGILKEIGMATMTQKRILLVDDDPDQRLTLRLPLETAGYAVFEAESFDQGLEKVKQIKPDLIILDVMMDTTTAGFQFALSIHSPDASSEFYEFKDIPIIMLTAIHNTTALRFSPDEFYLPVQDFLDKPVDPQILLETVRKHIPG